MNNNRNQRFRTISAAADRIVGETGVNPSEVTGYAVSMAAFDRKPNGDFYTHFEEWLKQRRAVPGAPPVDMPAEAAAELDEWTDRLKAQIMQRVIGIVRGVAGSFEQTTSLRVVALERLCADQVRRIQEVLGTLVDTEAELKAARAQIAALANELQQGRDRVQRLLGRLEERGVPLQAKEPEAADKREAAATDAGKPRPDMAALAYQLVNGPPDDSDSDVDDGDGAEASVPADPSGDAVGSKDQPPAIATDRPLDGQAALPPVTVAAADQAVGGGDGHG